MRQPATEISARFEADAHLERQRRALDSEGRSHGGDQVTLSDIENWDDEKILQYLFRCLSGEVRAGAISRDLLHRYKTIDRVFMTNTDSIQQNGKMTAGEIRFITLFRVLLMRVSYRRAVNRIKIGDFNALIEYLNFSLAGTNREVIHSIFLDRENCLIEDEVSAIGTVNYVQLYCRNVAARALSVNACAVLIVQNRLSVSAEPSRSQVSMAHELQHALGTIGVLLHDWIVATPHAWQSFRRGGVLSEGRRHDP